MFPAIVHTLRACMSVSCSVVSVNVDWYKVKKEMWHIHVMFWSHYTSNCAPVSCQCPAKGHILSAAKTACVHMETFCIAVGQQFSYTWASSMWSTGTLREQ
jgi:hypothetical protein